MPATLLQGAADGEGARAAAELAELQEEFQRRLGAADRTIAALKVGRETL